MNTDTPSYIGQEVKGIMEIIADIDPYMPDEDMVEILIGSVGAWSVQESRLLLPALEAAFEGSETVTEAARERLNTLYALQGTIHDGEGVDSPFNELALKYIDAVKYHLVVDVQELAPLAGQLPIAISRELAASMAALKLDLE